MHRYGSGDVHSQVAARLVAANALPVLDIGCGEGELARYLPHGSWRGVDTSPTMLAGAPAPTQIADATALPFGDATFGGAALLYVLYHLHEPLAALREARRVVRADGLVVIAAPSRHDSPELADALPDEQLTFDAESGPALVADVFGDVDVHRWEAPMLELPDTQAIREYLTGKHGIPEAAAKYRTPLTVTKRGALLLARP